MDRAWRSLAGPLASDARAVRALGGGIAGTAAMTVVFLMLEVQTRAGFLLFEAIARFFGVPGRIELGFVAFVVFGVVVWPLVFALLDAAIPGPDDPVVAAMLFATALWVGFMLVGTGDLVLVFLPFYAAITLLPHLVYGFTLGLVYDWAAPEPSARTTNHRVDGPSNES